MSGRWALIVLNGPIGSPALVRKAARLSRGVICADGGLSRAVELGLKPDFVVGDMDSLPRPLPRLPKTTFWCDFDQDRSDFEKSLEFARRIGCDAAFVAGATGGALDHALVNAALLERCAGLELTLLDRGVGRLLGPGRGTVALKKGERFSLIAASTGAVVSLSGARFALAKAKLAPGSRGLGNEAKGAIVLTIHAGRTWLVVPRLLA